MQLIFFALWPLLQQMYADKIQIEQYGHNIACIQYKER